MSASAASTASAASPTFETFYDALNSIKATLRADGFSCKIGNSVKADGQVRFAYLFCSRGGRKQATRSTGKRLRSTTYCGCSWAAVISRNATLGRWIITEKVSQHNHPGAKIDAAVASFRRDDFRKNEEDITRALESLAASTALTSREIATQIHRQFGVRLADHDVRNQLSKLRVDRLGPFTSTKIFVDTLLSKLPLLWVGKPCFFCENYANKYSLSR